MKRFKNFIWRPHFNIFKRMKDGDQHISKFDINKSGKAQVVEYIRKFCGAARVRGNLELPLSKRIKRYPMYRTVSYNNKIYCQFRYGDLKQFKKHYSIGTTNRIVGYTPDHVGFRPSEIVISKNYITEFLLNKIDKIKSLVSRDCYKQLLQSCNDTRVTYSGGYDTVHSHLKQFLKNNSSSIKANEIIERIGEKGMMFFNSPVINFNDVKELMYNVRVNNDAYTGHYTSKLINRKTGNVNHISREVAKMMWYQLRKHPLKNVYLWDILGREKDIKLDNSGDVTDVGTRAVLATEDSMKTLLMWFAQKFHVALNTVSDKVFNIEGEYDAKKYTKLYEYEQFYDYKLDADWTQFDANCDTQYIIAACSLLLSGMPEDTLHKNIKNLIISSIVTKYVVIPPGIVVELNRGVPSGHPFTTLINCTINTIYWCLIAKEIYGDDYHDKIKFEVYGDDTYIYFKYHENLFKIDSYINKLKLRSEPLSEKLQLCNFDYLDSEKPDFLKRRFDGLNLKWNYKKMFDRMIYPSKRRNMDNQIQLITSFYLSTPLDEDMILILELFYEWICGSNYFETVRNLDSFKYLEELVKLKDNDRKIKFNNFLISNISINSVDYFSKITDLISSSVYILKDTIQEAWKSSTNEVQRVILYSLAYPITFINKNKYIFGQLEGGFEYYKYDDNYYNKCHEFIKDFIKKNDKSLMNIVNSRYQSQVKTQIKYVGDGTFYFYF